MKRVLKLVVATIAMCLLILPAFAADSELVRTTLYSGETKIESSWNMGPSVYTTNGGGKFDPTEISKNGYFEVEYTGTEGAIYLAFSEWTNGTWASVNTPTSTEKTDTGYISRFSFDDCVAAYGIEDFSDVDAITVGSANSTTVMVIKELSWYGYPTSMDLGETAMLFKGSATASGQGTNLTFFYTKHVGGEWDASTINRGSYFYVEYTGAYNGVYLAFTSASGATEWVAVYADETGTNADGNYYSIFKYNNFSQKFGTNFQRLDQIQAYSATNQKVTLKRIAYFEGQGNPVDTSDGTWDRPTEGIAFIGDSIVQNPLVDSSNLGKIDWNGILNREDCVNYGIGGQTTKECAARIDELAKKNYSKVVMLCGINDIGRGHTNEEIADNYRTMIDALTAGNEEIEVFIISVLPTTSVYYTGAQHMIVALNEELAALEDEYDNVTFVDCHSSFVGSDGYCKSDLVFDGLHPNLKGYSVIAEILNPYLEDSGEVELEAGVIYKQTTSVVNGYYSVRFVQLITEDVADRARSVSYIISNSSSKVEKLSTACYSSIVAAGDTITAPEGYVFIAYAVTGVPENVALRCDMTINVGFQVSGTKLLDANRNEFVMRGINHSHAWFLEQDETAIKAIAETGSNCIRIVCSDGQQYNKDTVESLTKVIETCKSYDMIVVLEVHDITGSDSISDLEETADFWISVKDVLIGNEDYVILNIANEWMGSWDGYTWCNGYTKAIPELRDAGILNTIMVDSAGWGQYAQSIADYGKQVFESDIYGNTMFSIHMYGTAGKDANTIKQNLTGATDNGLCVVVGEFGYNHSDGDVDEGYIMQYCVENSIGYLGWSWKGNGGGVEYLDIAVEWDGSDLSDDWGEVLINGTYGIKNTSVKCSVY